MNEDKIIEKLNQHDEQLEAIASNMATKDDLANGLAAVRKEMATKDDLANGLRELKDEMLTGFDKLAVILNRLDQERIFTSQAVAKEEDVQKIKVQLNLT